jgi:hypothetical protein
MTRRRTGGRLRCPARLPGLAKGRSIKLGSASLCVLNRQLKRQHPGA